ncbi:AAA family ATPase, partial [Vibrio parahaemolyticus]|nr:AAA family ATPase [Vibrio parahaemolyticus]
AQFGDVANTDMYVSDRRWKKAVKLLKASAFFNGRDEINPLDLLLLQDCLWNSPESRDVVREVVQEFALKHAFDQQDAEQEIEYCRESLVDVQHELEDAYRMTLTSEAATGILRKETMRFDTSKAKMYKVGAAVNLVKLVV